ncbi:MAG TPA: NAD(P)-dependent oxidoreductase [Gemmataceae bacterium]|nr:NAD(P)-dependent oxidoreductase [Gemmataceae bacterium]
MKPHVGFIGLGSMGEAMAANLLKAGYPLRVFNRTPEKAVQLVAAGAFQATQPADVAEPGGILISSLANDQAVEEAIGNDTKLLERLGKGGIHVSTSTIAPATARELAEGHGRHGVAYLACPVLGRPDAAAAAKLWLFLSGPPEAKERVQPLLQTLGQGVFDFGTDPESANVVKLACNFLIASLIEALGEAFALAEKNGIERTKVADVLGQTILASPAARNYSKQIAEKRYTPAMFKLPLGLKDIDLVLQTATASHVPMPLASLLHNRLLAELAKGHQDLDWTGLARGASEDAGLPT